jgi:hypothetical protein
MALDVCKRVLARLVPACLILAYMQVACHMLPLIYAARITSAVWVGMVGEILLVIQLVPSCFYLCMQAARHAKLAGVSNKV